MDSRGRERREGRKGRKKKERKGERVGREWERRKEASYASIPMI